MSQAAKRFYGVFGSIALIIIAGIVFISFIIPKTKEIQSLRSERSALVKTLSEKEAVVQEAEKLIKSYSSISGLQETLSLTLPQEEDVPGIVNQLQGLASLSGVVIDSLSLQFLAIRPAGEETIVEPIGTLRATMGVVGDYKSIKLYIEALETNIRIIDLNSLEITGGTEGDTLTYKMVVDTYYQR
jgi:Tfp pilus assembly protein PilO